MGQPNGGVDHTQVVLCNVQTQAGGGISMRVPPTIVGGLSEVMVISPDASMTSHSGVEYSIPCPRCGQMYVNRYGLA